MEVKIRVETVWPVSNQIEVLNVSLENVISVGDLKKKLQPLLRVAACDMSIYYDSSIKLENKERINNLYVHEGETFLVKFPSICAMEFLDDLLRQIRTFITVVCKVLSVCDSDIIDIDIDWDDEKVSRIKNYYENVIGAIAECCYDVFLPWSYIPTVANRHYFGQEEGIVLLKNIHHFASTRHYQTQLSAAESHWYVEAVDYFNEEQGKLEQFCLLCLWNFSELEGDRRMVLRTFGLEPFIYSLLKGSQDEATEMIHVNEASVGCLAQYVEVQDVQEILAQNQEVLTKLLWLTSQGHDAYCKETAANTLFCISNHPNAIKKIIGGRFHVQVLEHITSLLDTRPIEHDIMPLSPATGYFFSLFLCNIQILSGTILLHADEIRQIDHILETFLTIISPEIIGDFEHQHNYVWITLTPFVRLALCWSHDSYPHCNKAEVSTNITHYFIKQSHLQQRSPYEFTASQKIGLFSLSHLVKRKENCDLFQEEKLLDYLICSCWFARKCPVVTKFLPELDGFRQLQPPRLESITKAYLSKCFGFTLF